MDEALPADRPARELVGRQIGVNAQIPYAQLDFGYQERALDRGPETRYEESMVAAGIGARDRAGRKTAKTVRHQPFIAAGAVPNAAGIAAEDQERNPFSK